MPDFRARSNAELLDASFALYRRHFLSFFSIAVVGVIPTAAAFLFAPKIGSNAVVPNISEILSPAYVLILMIGGTMSMFIEAAIIAAAARAYLGGEVDIPGALRAGFRHPGRILGSVILKILIVGVGIIVAAIPSAIVGGIVMAVLGTVNPIVATLGMMLVMFIPVLTVTGYLFFRYFGVPAVIVLENTRVTEGLRRSTALARGHIKRIALTLGAAWLFFFLVTIMIVGLAQTFNAPVALQLIARLIVGGLIYPMIPIICTLLYYDIRIRKEGYDIELNTAALETLPLHPTAA